MFVWCVSLTVGSADVVVKIAGLAELAVTKLTCKWPLIRVDAEMLRKVAELNERLRADRTAERSVFEVEANVLPQLTGIEELLGTVRTCVGRASGVILRLHV